MEKLLPSPPGSMSFRHLPSQGSWIVSALASGDQVFGQMINLVPAGMEAQSLCFVISTRMIDDEVERKSPLHWPNRVLFLLSQNQSCKQKWIAFKHYKRVGKEERPPKTQVTFAMYMTSICTSFCFPIQSDSLIKVIYAVIFIWYSLSPLSPLS